MRELRRYRNPELREAWDVLRRETLRVLDPLPQAGALPGLPRLLERVERLAIRAVADRVHADGPACLGALADDLCELRSGRDLHAAAVEHPRGPRAERAVHEDLQVADPQQRRAEAAAQRKRAQRAQHVVRHGLPDAQGEMTLLLEALPEPCCAEPSVLVVHARDAARVRDLH